MEVTFKTKELQDLYTTPLDEMKGRKKFPEGVIKGYKKCIQITTAVAHVSDLRHYRSLSYEPLHGKPKGRFSLRVNDQYRVIFTPFENGVSIEVLELSKHYE